MKNENSKFGKILIQVIAGGCLFAAGAATDRIFFKQNLNEEEIKNIVYTIANKDINASTSIGGINVVEENGVHRIIVDPALNTLIIRENNWPGTLHWMARYGGEARSLFEKNNNDRCPYVQLKGRMSFCVFERPIEGDPSVGSIFPSELVNRKGSYVEDPNQ